jgi:hypothetical protein
MSRQVPPEQQTPGCSGPAFAVRHVENTPVTGSMERELILTKTDLERLASSKQLE